MLKFTGREKKEFWVSLLNPSGIQKLSQNEMKNGATVGGINEGKKLYTKILGFVVLIEELSSSWSVEGISFPKNLICFTAFLFQIIAETCQIFKFI